VQQRWQIGADIKSQGGRAAEYVRASTDHQKYSTQNQAEAISAYAAQRNLTIVRTYADEGRSGLDISGRAALRDLIRDVRQGCADFRFILVYDVSRWGRFQDADESAYYEFICKEAGIQVCYCAEQFENDGSLSSTMLKNIKRIMAGEFSRDLSTKVFIGQCRIVKLGFWHGGMPGYGLRRELLDERGISKGVLQYGQQKSLQADRVIIRPGPLCEVRIVKRVFRSFVTSKKSVTEIAAELNADQIATTRGNRWSAQTIDKILKNETYIGNIVFNRTSYKLKQRAVSNPADMWIRRDGALKGIVSTNLFAKAQELLVRRGQRLSDQDKLDRLSALWRKKGHLSHKIIVAAKNTPDTSTFISTFGSLTAAYARIGFQPSPRYRWLQIEAAMTTTINDVIGQIVSTIIKNGASASFNRDSRLLNIDHGPTVCIGSARAMREGRGMVRWHVRVNRQAITDWALIIRMDSTNTAIRDYYLLPGAELAKTKVKRLRITSRVFAKLYRHDTLDEFYRICEGSTLNC
jgi:DNA invertase Pin-like site-specific DNA recombinase